MIPPGFIHDLLARVDIVDVVSRHVELRKSGANLSGLCPFHAEKSPSFTVSPSKQFYHCFGCGAHGDAIRFLTEHLGLGFVEAVEDLAQQVGLQVPREARDEQARAREAERREAEQGLSDLLERAAAHFRRELREHPRAIDYLKRRGLTGEIAARFGLGYAPDRWRGLASAFPEYADPKLEACGLVIARHDDDSGEDKRYDRFRDRIMFPIRGVDGRVIGFGGRVIDQGEPKYLNSPETPVFVKGRELYGLHEARTEIRRLGHAIVVEGYMDVVALAQLGFGNAVATLGTACTADHVAKLLRFTDSIVFSFDGDAAGRRAAGRALEAALPHANDSRRLSFLFLPPEHDPDSFVRERGREAFEAAVAAAVPLSSQLVAAARDGASLEAAEDRAQMLVRAGPWVQAMPAGLLRRQIVEDLAQAARLPAAELAARWGLQDGRAAAPAAARTLAPPRLAERTPARTATARRGGAAPASPVDRAASLVARASGLWARLSNDDHDLLVRQPFPHGRFFAWIDRVVQDQGPMTPQALVEAAAASDDGPTLLPLFERLQGSLEWDHPEVDPADLDRTLRLLRLQALREETDLLLASGSTDAATLARHRQLMEQQARLREALASGGNAP
ncbi:MAG: DNA primase, partial [Ideonella sp.]|nr:DNA primase [Ideonella sp.]